jgi:hypothetical protein
VDIDTTPIAQQRRRRLQNLPSVLDVALEDEALLDEMRLTTELLIAASQCDGPMTQEEIDRFLGLG